MSSDTTQATSVNNNQTRQERNLGIDLLRMVSMYMVCMLHTLSHGGILEATENQTPKFCIAWLFEAAAFCASNCFALISGYVGVKATFKYGNLLRLWLQAFFYSASIAIIFKIAMPGSVGLKEFVTSFFPISGGFYWYFSAYALMFFTMPLMNAILNKLDMKLAKTFIHTFFVIFSLFSLIPLLRAFAAHIFEGYSALWLGYLYFIGGFIRTYGISELLTLESPLPCTQGIIEKINALSRNLFSTQRKTFLVYLFCIGISFLVRTVGDMTLTRFIGSDPFCLKWVTYISPTILFGGLALLILFARANVSRLSGLIQLASPLAFSIYLIHCQPQIWNLKFAGAFKFVAELPLPVMPLAIIFIPLAIYLVCSVVDYLRLKLFKALRIVPR